MLKETMSVDARTDNFRHRRRFLGGSDARVIMSGDEAALIRLWKEKRGEAEPEYLSDDLVVQLGAAAEAIYGGLAAILWGAFKARSAAPAAQRCNQASVCRPRVLAKTYADAAAIFGNALRHRIRGTALPPLQAWRDGIDGCRPRAGAQSQRQLQPFPRVRAGSNQGGRESEI